MKVSCFAALQVCEKLLSDILLKSNSGFEEQAEQRTDSTVQERVAAARRILDSKYEDGSSVSR